MSVDRVDLSVYMTDFCVVTQAEAPVNLVKLTDIEDTFGAAA
jgi:hypothetical protein